VRAPRTVRLPAPDGGPELDLVPSLAAWEAIEEKFGALGMLYTEHCRGRVIFRFMAELIWRCARNGGSLLTLKEVSQRCYEIGIHRTADAVDALWRDIMKPIEEPAGEGDAPGAPLASGD
jgi:tail tube GTA-gp10-like protein